MKDINEIRFSGIIERLQAVTAKTGTSMASWLVCVGRDKFKAVAFKNVADAVLACRDGDQISVSGTGSINSWKDNEEHWHNDFQVTAWEVEIKGRQVKYEKSEPTKQQRGPVTKSRQQNKPDQAPPPDDPDLNQYDYTEGPF